MQAAKERHQRIRDYFQQNNFAVNDIFPDINNLDLTEDEIGQISLGAIVTIMAYRLTKYANIGPVDDLGSPNRLSPYLKIVRKRAPGIFELFAKAGRDPDIIEAYINENLECLVIPHYPLRLDDLCSKAGPNINASSLFHNPEIRRLEMLKKIGQQVIIGKLPFDILILEEAFPEIKEELKYLATLIEPNSKYAQYCQIKQIFRQAEEASKKNKGPDGQNFRQTLESLRNKTLNNFLAGTSKYNAQGSIHVAKTALILAEKNGNKNITSNDIESFKFNTNDYIEHTWSFILINILAGMSIGSILGLLVGGIFSGVFAIPAGLFIGIALCSALGGAASLACVILNHPITEMAKTLPAVKSCDLSANSLNLKSF